LAKGQFIIYHLQTHPLFRDISYNLDKIGMNLVPLEGKEDSKEDKREAKSWYAAQEGSGEDKSEMPESGKMAVRLDLLQW
jgi:hypothetical protein